MNEATRPVANPVVVLREEFDDWAVLFNPDTAAAVGINPVGVAVWKRLDGKRTMDGIVSEIRASFSAVPDAAIDEATSFVEKLVAGGFAAYEAEAPAP